MCLQGGLAADLPVVSSLSRRFLASVLSASINCFEFSSVRALHATVLLLAGGGSILWSSAAVAGRSATADVVEQSAGALVDEPGEQLL